MTIIEEEDIEYCPERKAWPSQLRAHLKRLEEAVFKTEQAERTQGATRLEELQKIVAGFSKERFLGQQLIQVLT